MGIEKSNQKDYVDNKKPHTRNIRKKQNVFFFRTTQGPDYVLTNFWLCLDYFVSIEVLKLLEWAAALSPKGIKLNKEDIDGGTEQVQVNN